MGASAPILNAFVLNAFLRFEIIRDVLLLVFLLIICPPIWLPVAAGGVCICEVG